MKINNKPNLANVNGSITAILESNIDSLNSCTTVKELYTAVKSLLDYECLNTAASRRLLNNISKKRNLNDALAVVYNSMLAGENLSVL